MKAAIVEKLNHELNQQIISERQIVYILVEARKLLEQQGTLDAFGAFKLCSDWAVHPYLDRQPAQLILQYFDAYEEEHRKSGIGVKEYNFAPLSDFLCYKHFRQELVDALSPHGVAVNTLADDHFWRTFIVYYTSVIEDCPLKAKAAKTQLVSDLSAQAWPQTIADSVFPTKCVVEWTWTMKDGSYPKSVCTIL